MGDSRGIGLLVGEQLLCLEPHCQKVVSLLIKLFVIVFCLQTCDGGLCLSAICAYYWHGDD